MRQTVAFQTLPSRSFIGGLEQSAAWAAALSPIGVNLELPHSRKQSPRIVGIHTHVRAAGVFIHKQHFLPVFPAIGGAEYTAIRLRSIGVAQGASQHDVRVMRVNHHIGDSAGFFQPHQLPGLPCVQRLVNPIANGNVAANERFPGSRVIYFGAIYEGAVMGGLYLGIAVTGVNALVATGLVIALM